MQSKDMKKEIESFNRDNGNQNFSLKEMQILTFKKLEKIEGTLSKHMEAAAAEDGEIRGEVKTLKRITFGLMTVFGLLVVAIVSSNWM